MKNILILGLIVTSLLSCSKVDVENTITSSSGTCCTPTIACSVDIHCIYKDNGCGQNIYCDSHGNQSNNCQTVGGTVICLGTPEMCVNKPCGTSSSECGMSIGNVLLLCEC